MVTEDRIRYFAAARAVIAAGSDAGYHQLCQLQFARDGSIFVHFPYFPASNGIVSEIPLWPGRRGPMTLDLKPSGRVTSTLVKFTHHGDGRAHFSQDGRVRTEVRRQSFPLSGPIGHVFQMSAFGLSSFTPLRKRKRDRVYLAFWQGKTEPEGVVLTAQWRRKRDIQRFTTQPGITVGPLATVIERASGATYPVAYYGQPAGYPFADHVLMIACTPEERPTGAAGPLMIFLGGYNPHEGLPPEGGAPDSPGGGCLTFMYPVTDPETLAKEIGTIDLRRPD